MVNCHLKQLRLLELINVELCVRELGNVNITKNIPFSLRLTSVVDFMFLPQKETTKINHKSDIFILLEPKYRAMERKCVDDLLAKE